jgi:hypothetical protein
MQLRKSSQISAVSQVPVMLYIADTDKSYWSISEGTFSEINLKDPEPMKTTTNFHLTRA